MRISDNIIAAIGQAGGAVPGWQFSEWVKDLGKYGYLEANGTEIRLTAKGQQRLIQLKKEKTYI